MYRIRCTGMATALAILTAPSVAFAQPAFARPEAPAAIDGYGADLLPNDPAARHALLRSLAFDATLYGLSAYLQYEQLWRQALDRTSPGYTGFNRFEHARDLAGPGYVAFKVPNSDTLYSNAWIDLTRGPVEVVIPPTALRYFTLNIFDIWGNPSNLSTRTIGSGGGRFLFVPPGWQGEVPQGVRLFHAPNPQLWVLMRVFAQSGAELAAARRFQDGVVLTPPPTPTSDALSLAAPAPAVGATGLLRVLDHVLRVNGPQPGEEALVHGFRPLGVGGKRPFDGASLDAASAAAIEDGYKTAIALIDSSKTQVGMSTGTGWSRVNKGKYGYNYIRRSAINALGLGANVAEENSSFTTFVDGDGAKLDGATADYLLTLKVPPPVDAFWSVTLYEGKSGELYANPLKRYLINDRTPGLKRGRDGSVELRIQHARTMAANWLPAPAAPFFVVIRSYRPKPESLDGTWLPEPIRRVATRTPDPASK